MNAVAAVEIITALADGIDPFTGEVLPAESPYQHPDTVRALYKALFALRAEQIAPTDENELPSKAGAPWSPAEEQRLVQAFDGGASIPELALDHQRTRGAIRTRLKRLGKIEV